MARSHSSLTPAFLYRYVGRDSFSLAVYEVRLKNHPEYGRGVVIGKIGSLAKVVKPYDPGKWVVAGAADTYDSWAAAGQALFGLWLERQRPQEIPA